MTSGPADDVDPLLRALRSAASAASGAAARPGQLRSRLEAELGDDAARFRGPMHQLVAAAEEHVPATLSSQSPLSREGIERVAADLARTRGWTLEAARQTTSLWAAALGLADAASLGLAVRPSIPPPAPADPAPAAPAPEPARTPSPAPWVPDEPVVWDAAPTAETSVPPAPTPIPAPAPLAAAAPASPYVPAPPPPPPAYEPASAPRDQPLPEWPPSKRRLIGLKQSSIGKPVAFTQGYAGISVVAYVIAVAVLVTGAVTAVFFLTPEGSSSKGGPPVLLLGILVAITLGLGALLKPGLVIATEDGVEYTQCDPRMRKAKPETTISAPWSDVHLTVGGISRLQIGTRSIQLGPRSREFATAAAARTNAAS